jgi:hypothetical protein
MRPQQTASSNLEPSPEANYHTSSIPPSTATCTLDAIQLSPLVSCPLHQLLVLLLLHLQLLLPLHTDGMHIVQPRPERILIPQLPQRHALQERPGRHILLDELRAVREDLDLAVRIRRLLNCQNGLVDAVRGSGLFHIGGGLHLHGRGTGLLGERWRAEGQELAAHGVQLDIDGRLGSVWVLEVDAGRVLHVLDLVGAEGHLAHGALETVDRVGEGRCHVGHALGLGARGEDGSKCIVADRPGKGVGDRDGPVEGEKGGQAYGCL